MRLTSETIAILNQHSMAAPCACGTRGRPRRNCAVCGGAGAITGCPSCSGAGLSSNAGSELTRCHECRGKGYRPAFLTGKPGRGSHAIAVDAGLPLPCSSPGGDDQRSFA